MLRADKLQLSRGERVLIRGLDLSVAPGEILHVCGPNGCGKTTLLRALAGLILPDAGTLKWEGVAIRGDGGTRYRGRMLFLGHQPALKPGLTPTENLAHYQALRFTAKSPPDEALKAFGIDHVRDQPCALLSAGQRRRVALARLLCEAAPLWILDEPLTALDEPAGEHLAQVIEAHTDEGGSVVLTSHQALPLPAGRTTSLDLNRG